MRSAVEWAKVRAMDADGVSHRQIAKRLGINPRTVKRLADSSEPPSYRRKPAGSMLDRLQPVIGKLISDWPEIKSPRVTEILRDEHGYEGSVDLVRKRMAKLRPPSERPAQKTGYRPAQVMQIDWGEMPTRPKIGGKERRIYALVFALPYSGASTAHFSFDMTVESFLEGHVHAFAWLGGVPRECVYDNLRSAVARRDGNEITWNARFTQLRGHYAFHATACTPQTPREKGSTEGAVRHTKHGFWPARRFSDPGRARPPIRRLARALRLAPPPRLGPVHRLRAPRGRARDRPAAATSLVRLRRSQILPGPDRRLPKARRELLPGARGPRPSAGRAAPRPRPGLDHPPGPDSRKL